MRNAFCPASRNSYRAKTSAFGLQRAGEDFSAIAGRGSGSVPKCGAADVRKSRSSSLVDSVMSTFAFSPLRCRCCRHRFYRRLWETSEEESGETGEERH